MRSGADPDPPSASLMVILKLPTLLSTHRKEGSLHSKTGNEDGEKAKVDGLGAVSPAPASVDPVDDASIVRAAALGLRTRKRKRES